MATYWPSGNGASYSLHTAIPGPAGFDRNQDPRSTTLADAATSAAADESFTVSGSRAELLLSLLLRALFEPLHCE